jgi:NADH-quinone oxidoreductase subunit H
MSEFSYWILMIIGMIVTILGLILVAGYTVLFERRCLALLQDRYGPNRAGPLGLFQLTLILGCYSYSA